MYYPELGIKNTNKGFKVLILILLSINISCGPGYESATYKNLSREDKSKFEEYMILGKEVYNIHCINCHMANGKGLPGIMPPLAKSDYMANNQNTIPCLLRTGTKDTLVVNGREYPPQMPDHNLTNLDMAMVLTYTNNSWGNEFGFVPVKEVDMLLEDCD